MNTLQMINHDLAYISHSGVPGMSWRTHKFGKWQSQAVYAQGMPNPDAKEKTGIGSKIKSAAGKAATAISDIPLKTRAKNDAAYNVRAEDPTRYNTKAYRRLVGGAAAAGAVGAALGAGMAGVKAQGAADSLLPGITQWKLKTPQNIIYEMPGGTKHKLYGNTFEQAKVGAKLVSDNIGLKNPKNRRLIESKIENDFLRRSIGERNSAIGKATTAGAVAGAALGAYAGSGAYKLSTFEGYLKRGQGTLRGTRLSPRQQQVYRDTFDKYRKKYSESTKIGYGRVYGKVYSPLQFRSR